MGGSGGCGSRGGGCVMWHGHVVGSSAPGRNRSEYSASNEWPVAHWKTVDDIRQLGEAAVARMAGGCMGDEGGMHTMKAGLRKGV